MKAHDRSCCLSRCLAGALPALLGLMLLLPGAARAQDLGVGTTYITPFPEKDVHRLQAYGDSLAEGLLGGLLDSFGSDSRLQIQRKHHQIGGILKSDFEDELRTIEFNLPRAPVHIAVVMVGLYDRVSWRPPTGKRIPVGSDEWKTEYARRVDSLMRMFKRTGVALYWVGLPILRRTDASDDAQMINELVRERAYVNGQKFIDIFSQFSSETGAFSAYGPDLEGKNRLLREADGIHFTQAGNRKLAHFVEREIRRDLTQARSERNIPLAGAETEQRRIRLLRGQASGGPAGAKKETAGPLSRNRQAAGRDSAVSADGGVGDVKADNARITLKVVRAGGKEESVAIDIVRPAIPASVLAVVTRRESPDRASQMGESITTEIGGGLTVVSSVTLSAETGDRRRLPPTQTPYYRVLIKGERLTPKPGRADDFSWPRPEAPPADAYAVTLPRPSSVRLAPAKSRRQLPNG